MKEIDVIVACGVNSEKFAEFLIHSIEKTCSGEYFFNFLLGVNDLSVDTNALQNIDSKFNIEVYDCITSGQGSYGHGDSLDLLFPKIKSDIAMTCDVDLVLLEKNWDIMLIDFFDKTDIAIIGAEYDGAKYMKFPNLVFSLFKTKVFSECNVSFMPAPENERKIIIDDKNCGLYARNIGDIIDRDTGWQICHNLKSNGYSGYYLPLKRPGVNDDCKFMTSDMRGEEYVLNDVPICSHVGRSATRGFDHPIVIKWRNRVLEYLKESNKNDF